MLELLQDPAAWASLLTLTVMEIVLGIDNVIFISVLVSRLDAASAKRARQIATKGAEPMVAEENDKPTVIALREIAEGKVTRDLLLEEDDD